MTKERFDEKLTKLLKTHPDFVDDTGELLRDKVKLYAWDFDHDLINLLLTDEEVESKFFEEINGRWIFNNTTFVDYINDRNFYANSYTQFRNRIGLNIDNKSLRERGEVALVWPYKDCVLEGGQTREEEKRQEIFFNELLAPDEINRMLDPKVLTNWKRYTAEGEQDLTNIQWDEERENLIRDNLLIKGNNLIALHCLKQQFRGQVKLIYIDPPYNTKGDANIFGYNNSFNHSSWLTFMKNRLDVAKDLLSKDGVITVAIDDYEYAHLKLLCDEVFGSENYIGTIVVESKPSGRTTNTHFATCHEYALFYAKVIDNVVINLMELTEQQEFFFDREDDIGKYHLSPFRRSGGYSTPAERPNSFYPIYYKEQGNEFSLEKKGGFVEILPLDSQGEKRVWRQTRPSFLRLVEKGEIICRKSRGKWTLYIKDRMPEGRKTKTIWSASKYDASAHGTMLLKGIFDGEKVFSYPKSIHAVKDTINLLTQRDSNDIVLDFFAGSGTTGHAVLELNEQDGGNRQFILVEQLEKHIAVCKERLEKVIAQERIVDRDFLSCELMPYNEVFMERIQSAEYSEELFDILDEMSSESFLNWYINPEFPEEAADYFITIDDVDKQKQLLAELLDKNQLYVHLSEIEDEKFEVSESDKGLNRDFYGGDDDA